MGSLSVSAHKQKVKQSAIFMALNIVSRTRLEEFWAIHAKAKVPLTNWYNTTLKATSARTKVVPAKPAPTTTIVLSASPVRGVGVGQVGFIRHVYKICSIIEFLITPS
jgi:mRNA-degrading endonuclease HigB of HigAB toxin-antitoxin module